STLGMKVTPDSDSPSLKNLRPRTKRRHCRQGTGGERIASRRGSEPVQEQNRRMDALVRPQSKDGRGRPSYKSRCSSWTGSKCWGGQRIAGRIRSGSRAVGWWLTGVAVESERWQTAGAGFMAESFVRVLLIDDDESTYII